MVLINKKNTAANQCNNCFPSVVGGNYGKIIKFNIFHCIMVATNLNKIKKFVQVERKTEKFKTDIKHSTSAVKL